MPASRSGERGSASASAAGAGQESADTTGGRSLSRCRASGVTMPIATAPHASRRRTREERKACAAYPAGPLARTRRPAGEHETPSAMPSVRAPLLTALILSAAIPSSAIAQERVDWYTDTGGGGALARPAGESRSGGAVAPPTATGPEELPESDISAT